MSVLAVGCCGAYCRTCPAFQSIACKGCKIGYENGEREISKAKCKIKGCCINKNLRSCSDCDLYDDCDTIDNFHTKKGYKYEKYKQALSFIRQYGYDAFLGIADEWKNAYGKYP